MTQIFLKETTPCYRRLRINLLALLLALGSIVSSPLYAEYQVLDKIVAIADDDVVLASEIRDKMRIIKTNAARQGGQLPPDSVLYEKILEQLILEKLQLQRAFKVGLRISDQELNEAMQRIAAQNGLTLPEFLQVLEEQGDSYAELREQTRQNMLLQQIQQRSVMRNISISPSEVDNFLESEKGQQLLTPEYSIDHILVPVSADASTSVRDSGLQKAMQLKQLAQGHSQFVDITNEIEKSGAIHNPLGWRRAEDVPSIFADSVKKLRTGQVSEPIRSDSGYHLIRVNQQRGGVAEQSTETRVSHILLKEQAIRDEQQTVELMNDLVRQLEEGADFAALARRWSDDPGSALKGGDLGWTLPGVMVKEFERVMLATPVGEISKPFKSQYGWHVLTVVDRRSKDMTEDNARRMARLEIAKSKYDDELNNWLQEMRDNAFVEIK